MSNTCPVPIRGVIYPSMTEAARVLGVSVSSVNEAKRQGRLDRVGLRPMKKDSIIVALSRATPDDFPKLQQEAEKWLAFHSKKAPKRSGQEPCQA